MVDMTKILRASVALKQRERIEALTNLYLNSLISQGVIEDFRVYDIMRDLSSVKGYNLVISRTSIRFIKRSEK